ncbi:MAG: kinase, partial [Alphaproteobacteria bacterium]
HHHPRAASHLFNRYLEATSEDSALTLWPLLLALRATIRGMASAGAGSRARAARYREVAEAAIAIKKRRLWVAIGGLSGSGKSTVSRILAPILYPAPGALWLRSDGIRKRLFGRLPEERLENPDAYAPAAHARTYRRLLSRARFAAHAGWPAILDATWIHAGTRDRLDDLAGHLDIPLLRFWIDAAPKTLRQRVADRQGEASDADLKVLEGQLAQWQGVPPGWTALPGEESPQELAERIVTAANLADK